MNGDDVRNRKFVQSWRGYHNNQVDELLDRVAAGLDAGRAVSPLVTPGKNAVDAFLDEIRRYDGDSRPAPQDTDPWRDFEHLPATRLGWARTGPMRRELRTDDQQTLVTLRHGAFSAGERIFRAQRVRKADWAGVAQAFGLPPASRGERGTQLADDAGMPVLYTAGDHFDRSAHGYIRFSGQRLLRFPVRGRARRNAIMTAVDQGGNEVARYRRLSARQWLYSRGTVEIVVDPRQRLTDDLAIALALSAPWLSTYFRRAGTG